MPVRRDYKSAEKAKKTTLYFETSLLKELDKRAGKIGISRSLYMDWVIRKGLGISNHPMLKEKNVFE